MRQANLGSAGFAITNPLPVTISPNPLPVIGSSTPGVIANPNVLEVGGQSNDGFGVTKIWPIPISLDGKFVSTKASPIDAAGQFITALDGGTPAQSGLQVAGVAHAAAVILGEGKAGIVQLNLSGQLKVDGSGVTQPVSGTFFQVTQPVSIAATLPVTLPVGQAVELLDSAGTNKAAIGTTGALSTNLTQVAGFAVSTVGNGQQRVGIVGNTGVILDGIAGVQTAPVNTLVWSSFVT
jgi:hypothetical protein